MNFVRDVCWLVFQNSVMALGDGSVDPVLQGLEPRSTSVRRGHVLHQALAARLGVAKSRLGFAKSTHVFTLRAILRRPELLQEAHGDLEPARVRDHVPEVVLLGYVLSKGHWYSVALYSETPRRHGDVHQLLLIPAVLVGAAVEGPALGGVTVRVDDPVGVG